MRDLKQRLVARMAERLQPMKTWGKRIVFSLLAIWVHCTVFFFLVMTLFSGRTVNTQALSQSVVKSAPIAVEVQLHSQPVAATAAATSALTDRLAPPLPQPEDPTPTIPETKPTPPVQNEEVASEDGVAGCDTLAKKPQRIIFGPSYLDTKPDDTLGGHTQLRVKIHRDGTVLQVTVKNSTMNKELQEKIVQAAYNSIFMPGEIGGVAVDCNMTYEVSVTPP
jgi:TonB family protein